MEPQLIKRLLHSRVAHLRRNTFSYESLDRPQAIQTDMIVTPEGPVQRRRIILTAHGCSVATCSMCPLPDEAVPASVAVTLDNWLTQIRAGISPDEDIHTLTLFHNGNFFADREVPPAWRKEILSFVGTTRVKELVVECLPQYLTDARLDEASHTLNGVKLVVAIGLQSSSELVREFCISTTCLENTFQKAIARLHARGFDAQVFLMFHPAFLRIEESVHDLRASIRYAKTCGSVPIVCPMRIAPNTLVADLADRGLYQVPNLWHLYDALTGVGHVRVATSLLAVELGDERYGADPLREAFAELNRAGTLPPITHQSRPTRIHPVEPVRAEVMGRIVSYLQGIS